MMDCLRLLRHALVLLGVFYSIQGHAALYGICPGSDGSYKGGIIVQRDERCPDGSMVQLGSGNPFTWDPYSLDFGNVELNTRSSGQTITITNITDSYLRIPTPPTFSSGFASGSSTTCPTGYLNSKSSCTITVYFTPTSAGTVTGQVSFKTAASSTPNTINLSGVGVAPAPSAPSLSLSVATLNFGSLTVNTQSASQTVIVKNVGSNAISITKAIGISGDFYGSSDCTSGGVGTLNPGASCTLSISFKPTVSGARSGVVTITTNDAYSSIYSLTLKGTGTAITPVGPALSLSLVMAGYGGVNLDGSTSLNFGSMALNKQSTAQTITIKNTSATTINFSKFSVSGDFGGSTNCTSGGTGSLAAGASCNVTLTFMPSVAGARKGTLTIVSTDTYTPSYTVNLAGTGTAPVQPSAVLVLSAASLDFGSVGLNGQGSKTLTIKNNSNVPVAFSKALTVNGDFSGATTCTSNGTGTLAAGASCNVTLTFTPSATGLRNGVLTITGDDATQVYTVGLSGTGVAADSSAASCAFNTAVAVKGAVTSQAIDFALHADCNDTGKTGSLYVWAEVPGMGIFDHDPAGWYLWDGVSPRRPYAVDVKLSSRHDLNVASNMDLTPFIGTKVYAGYGVGASTARPDRDMMSNGAWKLFHVVSASSSGSPTTGSSPPGGTSTPTTNTGTSTSSGSSTSSPGLNQAQIDAYGTMLHNVGVWFSGSSFTY